uniref:Uncharacterized protein n=1 Tax=Sphaerodactylus townsendi TaxID=933632 RepID=A0ACB8ER73_9SAUR
MFLMEQLPVDEAKEQQDLKALVRWQRLQDEMQNSEEDLQVLRPHRENTGKVSESGASVIKHGLNAEKTFLQVHYLKGYFLLRSFVGKAGEAVYFAFLRKFVQDFHGQLILSQWLFPPPLHSNGRSGCPDLLPASLPSVVVVAVPATCYKGPTGGGDESKVEEDLVIPRTLPDSSHKQPIVLNVITSHTDICYERIVLSYE